MIDFGELYNNIYFYFKQLLQEPVFYVYLGIIIFLIVTSIYIYSKYLNKKKNALKLNDEYYTKNSKYANGKEGPSADLYIFHTTWCPHSKKALDVLDKFESENKSINDIKINYLRIDADKDEKTADKYKVESYPTLILLYNGNKIIYDANVKPQLLKVFLEKSLI
tara:strand:+ start:181 stop:675 length:495 start_codon:yes stop_codon:yes gene_type:complete